MERARGAASTDAPASECVGCREPIRPGARVCPHCATVQRPRRWSALGQVLKWMAGVTALACLVLAVAMLGSLYASWRERQAAVTDLVAAARLQGDTGDYAGAWRLLEEALHREPGIAPARELRAVLAMKWLRSLASADGESFSQTLDLLLPALYVGTVEGDPVSRADGLAHLGWANFLRAREGVRGLEIEDYYRRALASDPSNVFAHAMWGHWLLWPGNPRTEESERVARAFDHFEAALQTGRARRDVRALQLRALMNYELDPQTRLAAVAVANEVRIEGGTLAPETARGLLRILRRATARRDTGDAEFKRRLDSALPAAELLATYRWMLLGLAQSPAPTDLYALGELAERSGYQQRALAFYHQSFEQASSARSVRSRAAEAIERLTGRSPGAVP